MPCVIFLQTTTKQSKPKQTNKHGKKKPIEKENVTFYKKLFILQLQAMAQRQSPNDHCELANNNKPQHIQQDPLQIPQVDKSAHTSKYSSFTKENESK
jgi:hypothetical protein